MHWCAFLCRHKQCNCILFANEVAIVLCESCNFTLCAPEVTLHLRCAASVLMHFIYMLSKLKNVDTEGLFVVSRFILCRNFTSLQL